MKRKILLSVATFLLLATLIHATTIKDKMTFEGPVTISGALTTTGTTTATGVTTLTSPVLVNPAIGTPTSGVLTSCTGLPTAGLVDSAVTYVKIQDISATDKILGRSTAGAGVTEEIACTAAGRAILDDTDNVAQLVTLGLTATATEINTVADGVLTGSKTEDVASIAADNHGWLTVTVTGAALGDYAQFSAGVSLGGLIGTCYVSEADIVTIILENQSAAAIDLASTTWKAKTTP